MIVRIPASSRHSRHRFPRHTRSRSRMCGDADAHRYWWRTAVPSTRRRTKTASGLHHQASIRHQRRNGWATSNKFTKNGETVRAVL